MKDGLFIEGDLRLVRPAPPPDIPPLQVGDFCKLNSGGPSLLVVAVDGSVVTVGWNGDNSIKERTISRVCVRRTTR